MTERVLYLISDSCKSQNDIRGNSGDWNGNPMVKEVSFRGLELFLEETRTNP